MLPYRRVVVSMMINMKIIDDFLLIVLIQSPPVSYPLHPHDNPILHPIKKHDNPIEAPLNHHSSLIIPAEIFTIWYI